MQEPRKFSNIEVIFKSIENIFKEDEYIQQMFLNLLYMEYG